VKVAAVLKKRLGHEFADPELLRRALRHSSAAQSAQGSGPDNERLEFLGDRVLGLVIADMLLKAFPGEEEGKLARRFNALVRRETCAAVAREIDLGAVLVLGKAEVQSGGQKKETILADACEAVLAALYLDGGLAAASRFIHRLWGPRLQDMTAPPRDPKTLLQEWAQGRGLPHPQYRIIGRSGPDHAPDFEVEVNVRGFAPTTGQGASKRRAEQNAARSMLAREGVESGA
jgi:ribonuclease-3